MRRAQNATILLGAVTIAACSQSETNVKTEVKAVPEIVTNANLDFIPLNPARGDAAPQAGVLWGDIRADMPSGVLLKFADGFTSPPHIHNITYRAVVIEGAVHNDDPTAVNMWMEPGSFWTQPAGENHITAGRPGAGATAFLEIMEGPYLVQPSDQAYDTGERPINVAANNVVWLDASDVSWVNASTSDNSVQMAFLWGDTQVGQKNGTFLKLPPQSSVTVKGNTAWLRAVVTKGDLSYHAETDITPLGTGSYFGSKDGGTHTITCRVAEDCVLYISAEGRYDVGLVNPK
ncbi:MAG: DUF4437 domain-containing protein [Acidimicrobiales bacterium]|nr:DUF4437 domain-containing protein [Hyphomonadaceae bacterium]RZV41331.1 MAG: DUF4437 domain-containing protein [Acidimicrobiales bacterium]